MGFAMVLILAIFWAGVVCIILAAIGVIAASPWVVAVIWIMTLAVAVSVLLAIVRLSDDSDYQAYSEARRRKDQEEVDFLSRYPDYNNEFTTAFDKAKQAKDREMQTQNAKDTFMYNDYD
jgi:hypothetical protein